MRRAVLGEAVAALRGLEGVLGSATDAELPALLGELDEVAALAGAGRVAVTAEALSRGTVAGSQAGSLRRWVAENAPSQRGGGAGAVARVAEGLGEPGHEAVRSAVLAGEVSPQVAASVLVEFDRMRPSLREAAEADVLGAMLALGATHGARGVREVRPALLERFGSDGMLQGEQDQARRFVALSRPVPDVPGTAAYRLVLDAEGQAVLEAAIGPLSAPMVGEDGEPDPRPDDRRRGEALIEVCRRTTAAAAAAAADDGVVVVPAKATLLLTMAIEDLTARTSAARVMGTTEAGTLIAPETARRIACDAGVVPAVLGSTSEVLDLGRRTRLFTLGQTRALWLRDGSCTFPGCDAPAFWCDAHHLVHWADGGETCVANAALLCARHHTIVHRDRLAGWVAPDGVAWDRRIGSYDELLPTTHERRRGGGDLDRRDPAPRDDGPPDAGPDPPAAS